MTKTNPNNVAFGTWKASALAVAFLGVVLLCLPQGAGAQVQGQPQGDVGPQIIDTVVVEGNERLADQQILTVFGIQRGDQITYRDIQRGIKDLFATGQFQDVTVRAEGTTPIRLIVEVSEQAEIRRVQLNGLENLSEREVRDTTNLRSGWPYTPQKILDARNYIREELAAEGIPFVRIEERIEPVEGENEVDVILDVTEGQRVTVADVIFRGNEALGDGQLAGAMSSKKEGFWWFRTGGFDETRFQEDLEVNLPALYRSRGYLEFQVVDDTVVVDAETGKARVEVTVDEGPQYRLASFSVEGNTRFTDEELEGLFLQEEGGLLRSLGFGGDEDGEGQRQVFDAQAFQEAIVTVRELYANEGYLYANVNPVVNRLPPEEEGGSPLVEASWQVTEGQPAIINRISIAGNEYTYDWVIRNQIYILPGDVYSQQRILRSYQSISSLGFFETPLPFPNIEPLENGDVNVTFQVQERQTGSINFGTTVGGGVGLSGFIGYEQPNLFGQAKSGTLRWDFGRYLNSFEVSYSDPALFQSLVSGSLSLFNSRDRFFQFSTGRRRRIGANTRFGFPWPGSRVTRLVAGYGITRTKYELFRDVDDTSLFGRPPGVQSTLTLGLTRQTLDHPLFPTVGSRQSINVEANGGILGGDGDFTRVLLEGSWWVPTGRLGGQEAGGGGVRFSLGLSLKAGAIFGDAAAFPFDRFWMGGVQFGQPLRGYDETTITPQGYFPERARGINEIDRLGDAFMSVTAEYAIRLNSQISIQAFYDAGNVWRDVSEFDPGRLFRGAGVGLQLVTPFGPIGLDYGYGFDKTDPGWQLHFRMGPGF